MKHMKNGFTLVELLAVIVILAVVMLIAVTSVGPMMEKSRKSALATEGVALTKAAEAEYNSEQLKGSSAAFLSTSTICLTLKRLNSHGYYEKSETDNYYGSVLITYDQTSGKHKYKYWITNGTYAYLNAEKDNTDPDAAVEYNETLLDSLQNCGGEGTTDTNYVACDNDGCYPKISATNTLTCQSGYKLVNNTCYKIAKCSQGTRSGNTCTYNYGKSYYCTSGTQSGSYCYTTTSKTCPSGYTTYGSTTCRRTTSSGTPSCSSGVKVDSYCYATTSKTCPSGYTSYSSTTCRRTTSSGASPCSGSLVNISGYCYATTSKICPSGYTTYSSTTCRRTTSSGTPSCSSGVKVGSYCYATTSKTCPSGYSEYSGSCRKQLGSTTYGCAGGGTSTGTDRCRKITNACSNYDSTNDVCLESTMTPTTTYTCPAKYALFGTECTYSG